MALFSTGWGSFNSLVAEGPSQKWDWSSLVPSYMDSIDNNDWDCISTNGGYASAGSVGGVGTYYTQYLAMKDLTDKPPIGSFIYGIEVRTVRASSFPNIAVSADFTDDTIQLYKGGSYVGTNKSVGSEWTYSKNTTLSCVPAYFLDTIFGDSTDLWDAETMPFLTTPYINATNFGFVLRGKFVVTSSTVGTVSTAIDGTLIKIHYNPTGMFMAM